MTRTLTTTSQKIQPRRPWRRWTLVVGLALVLAGAAILFMSRVYNPFGATIETPLTLIPVEADFVLSIPDFPEFVGTVRNKDAIETLATDEGFKRFLKTPWAREKKVMDTLREVFRKLDELSGTLPLGLELLGDVSGRHVLVSGYLPDQPEDPIRYMAVFQPGSWKTLAGVNVLMDETLFNWFLRDALGKGVEVEHSRDQVMLKLPGLDQQIWITRIADTILVSTEERELARIRNAVERTGLPESPPPRFMELRTTFGRFEVQFLARRKKVDAFLGLERELEKQWGPDNLSLAEATAPRLGSEDILCELEVGRGIGIAVDSQRGESAAGDLAPLFRPFDKAELADRLGSVTRLMPKDAFGLISVKVPLGELLNGLLNRPELLTELDRRDLETWAQQFPAFGSSGKLFETLDRLTDPWLDIVFFRQPRDALDDVAEAGFVLVAGLRDPEGARNLLSSLREEVERAVQSEGKQPVNQLYKATAPEGWDLYKVVVEAGVVDNPEVTIPGVAIGANHIFLTNYFPFLRQLPDAVARRVPTMADGGGLEVALSNAPQSLLTAGMLDGKAIYPYLEQSAPGWATSKTAPTDADYEAMRSEAMRRLRQQGLSPGSPGFQIEQDRLVKSMAAIRSEVDRPKLLESIREYLGYFEGLVGGFGFFVENAPGGARLSLRVDFQRAGSSP